MAFAIRHNSFELMGFAHDSHGGCAWKRAVRQYLREPFANLFEIAKHGLLNPSFSSPAIRARDEH